MILALTVILSIAAAFYFNVLLGISIVYTHLFYIPIVIAGAWYHRRAVLVALLLGLTHIGLQYLVSGAFVYDALVRALIFLAIAYIVGIIAEKKDNLYSVLKSSRERLEQMRNSLDERVRERTAELSRLNESLKGEILERKQAEAALRDSEEKFRALTEASPAAIILYRENGLVYVNRAVEIITGFSRDELLAMRHWNFVHPDSRDIVLERSVARMAGHDVPTRYEIKILTKAGEERWFDISARRISYDGKQTGMVSGIDITPRKKAEKALLKSRAILARAQGIAHVGNWAWDLRTNALQWSDEIFRIYGCLPGEFTPSQDWVQSRIHPDDRQAFTEAVGRASSGGELFNIDYRISLADGSLRYVNCVADKLRRDKTGNPIWLYGILQDITARKKVEEELKESKAQAELYLDLMGHDINNINQIGKGFLELALETLSLDDDARQMLAKPLEAMESSTRLISNVRKLQRARDGSLLLYPIDVGRLLRDILPGYSNVAGREISIDLHDAAPCYVLANDLLADVFSNILNNSIKHSTGFLAISIAVKSATIDDARHCIVSFEDDGPGIPDDRKGLLFNSGERGRIRRAGGGLGLYLVKTLVDDFHGTVRVEDRIAGDYTQGCRFVFTLPAIEK